MGEERREREGGREREGMRGAYWPSTFFMRNEPLDGELLGKNWICSAAGSGAQRGRRRARGGREGSGGQRMGSQNALTRLFIA